jgi:hypothetical protein
MTTNLERRLARLEQATPPGHVPVTLIRHVIVGHDGQVLDVIEQPVPQHPAPRRPR